MDVIKVASNSKVSAVAGAVAHRFRENNFAAAQAIGANAVNQMLKATIMAKRFLQEDGIETVFVPEFIEVDIDGKLQTAVFITFMPINDPTIEYGKMTANA